MKRLLPLTLFFTLSTCSGMNVIGQMMMDAGEMMADAGNGHAQPATPAKVLTAATDPAQLDTGVVTVPGTKEVVTGPFMVAHLREGQLSNEIRVWITETSIACDMSTAPQFRASGMEQVFVKAGFKLCATGSAFGGGTTTLLWSGFKPY